MRILHVTDSYAPTLGGIEVMVEQLSGRQRAAGHQVRVLTLTRGPATDDVYRNPARLGELLAWAETVHVHVSMISPLAATAARMAAARGLPTVASVHSLWTGGEPLLAGLSRAAGHRGLPIVWAPVSAAAAASVRRALGPQSRVVVLPNAIHTDFWAPATGSLAAGAAGATRPFTVVSVGRMAARKRPLAMVQMLAELRAAVPPQVELRAVLAGDGSLRGRVERRVRRLGLAGWVSVPGALSPVEVRSLYATSDVFLAASRLESFGLAALEAHTSGLRVAALHGTGVQDFAGPSDVLADDDAGLVAGLAALAERGPGRAHLQAAAADFGWPRLLAGADALYGQAAALQAARRGSLGDLVRAV